MKPTERKGIELRIKMIEDSKGVFGRKSEEYKSFCLQAYKLAIKNNDNREWDVIVADIEGKAKEKFVG